jgi:DNA-binding HxlR family transcriptional regulator
METDRRRYSAENCTIARTLEIVGEKWTLLVLREAFYGLRRFADFEATIGCARNILSDRLRTLVEHGVLTREPYQEPGQRPRSEYRLTDKGLELLPALLALMQWGDRWVADEAGPPVRIAHRNCGQSVEVRLVCGAGHDGLTARETVAEPGPGAKVLAAREAPRGGR